MRPSGVSPNSNAAPYVDSKGADDMHLKRREDMDPRRNISVISWNVGGLTTQSIAVRELIVKYSPSIVVLQEARATTSGSYAVLRSECRLLGYTHL